MADVVKLIRLDAQMWREPLEFYNALLQSLGAPEWHGRNVNALIDSMIYGGINKVEPPYRIAIAGTHAVPGIVSEEIKLVKKCLEDAQSTNPNEVLVVMDLIP